MFVVVLPFVATFLMGFVWGGPRGVLRDKARAMTLGSPQTYLYYAIRTGLAAGLANSAQFVASTLYPLFHTHTFSTCNILSFHSRRFL